eukprot:CAMPEP_0114658666 /NCGR_PEP_ID=MMETSP0191-20121206/16163_1 /TAXON_ID=126664 /ORGANISM="Sorites sp." /LENGTH=191 /DNA_ID=CAMNT_0001881291 /DNA_START=1749 /DNA_END=2321 /DNA_ORIENTATION=-
MEQPKILKSENDSNNDTIAETTKMLNKDKMSKSDTDTDAPVIEGHYTIAKNESTVESVIDEVIIITDDNQGQYSCNDSNIPSYVDPKAFAILGPNQFFFPALASQNINVKGFKAFKRNKGILWNGANKVCEKKLDDTLACIHSIEEQYAFLAAMDDAGCIDAWFGMKNIKTPNKYSWIDSSIITDNDYSGW